MDAKGKVIVPASAIRRVGPEVSRPERIAPVQPVWPKEVRLLGVSILETVIDETGSVCAVRVLKAPSEDMGEAVAASLRASRFEPARFRGRAVAVRYVFTVYPHPQ